MTLLSWLLPPKAISCGFSILCAGEDAFAHFFVLQRRLSFTVLCFLAFLLSSEHVWLSPSCLSVKTLHSCLFHFSSLLTPEALSRVFLLLVCWRRRVYSILHGLRERRGLGGSTAPPPPAHLQRGGPFEEGCEGVFARDSFLRLGEDTFILLIIVIVIVIAIVTVRKQSVKRSSREAQKLKSKRKAKEEESNQQEKNNKQSKQGRAASEKLKRKAKQTIREAEKQKSREARQAEKHGSRKAEGSKKKY